MTFGTRDALYTYDVDAIDPDGDVLVYSLSISPAGMTIQPDTGLIEWTPSASQVGDQSVTVSVSDGPAGGGPVNQSFVVAVRAENQPPYIASIPVLEAAITDFSVLYLFDEGGGL